MAVLAETETFGRYWNTKVEVLEAVLATALYVPSVEMLKLAPYVPAFVACAKVHV